MLWTQPREMQWKDLRCGEMEASNFLLREITSADVSLAHLLWKDNNESFKFTLPVKRVVVSRKKWIKPWVNW